MSQKLVVKNGALMGFDNKIMGIKNDYPFWQINADTSEGFFNAYDSERLAAPFNIEALSLVTGPAIGQNELSHPVLAPDGITVYFPPFNSSNIRKYNSVANTSTLIPIPSSVGNNISGGVLRGKFIYFMPLSYAHIIKLDTTTDTFTLIGNYPGSNKWGRPILLSNGTIIAPGRSATTWLVVDKNDVVTFVTMDRTSVEYSCCAESSDGFVYAFNETVNQPLIDRINIDTLAISTVAGFTGITTVRGVIQCTRYRNLVFLLFGGDNVPFVVYNMNTNQFTRFDGTPTYFGYPTSFFGSILLGPDGFIYYIPSQAQGNNYFYVYNPITFQRYAFTISSANFTRTWQTAIFNKNGSLVFSRFVNLHRLDLGIPLKENRYLSRIVNK
jgi:hypothetical protein